MNRAVARATLAVLVCVGGVTLLASPAEAQGWWRRPPCLAPNGVDDTASLEEALEGCSGASGRCTVRLCQGVFRIAPVRVGDFRGVLQGRRRGGTVIQALPQVRVNANPDGYWRDDPLDPGLDPWPYLLQFIGGEGTIRDLTIEVPTPAPGERPTEGWTEVFGLSYEMAGAILITGRDPVSFDVSRVRIVGSADPESGLGITLFSGVSYRGLLFNPADPGDFPVQPVSGEFRLSRSEVSDTLSGTSLGEMDDARVRVFRNDFQSLVGVDVLDSSRAQVYVWANQWDVGFVGVQVILNIDGEPSQDNTFLVSSNRGTVGPYFGWGSGVYFADPWILPEPGGSTLDVRSNQMSLGTAGEAARNAVEALGAGRLRVGGNQFDGRAGEGIVVDETAGCQIWNSLEGLDTGGGAHLELGAQTSECLAVVGPDDVVVDDGTDNQVFRY